MRKSFLVIALIAGSAEAQFNPGLFQSTNYLHNGLTKIAMNNVMNHHTMERLKRSNSAKRGEQVEPDDGPPDAASDGPSLAFTPSITMRRANYARFVERSRSTDPAGADELADTLRGDPVAMMAPELAKVGLRVDNVADAYAVYWVEAWQALHGITGASSRATAHAVREQAARAIMATPAFANATAAQKQEFAESYLVQALLIGAAKDQAGGDRAKLAQVSAAVDKGARAAGLDLRAMTLTEEGFSPAG